MFGRVAAAVAVVSQIATNIDVGAINFIFLSEILSILNTGHQRVIQKISLQTQKIISPQEP